MNAERNSGELVAEHGAARGPESPTSSSTLHVKHSHSHTDPRWRVLAVVLIGGGLAALGRYLQVVGHGDDFATIATIALLFTVSFWAHQRPDRVRTRFGPFGRVADAFRESIDDIRAWVYERSLRVGFALAVGYGTAIVIIKSALHAALAAMYSWELAVIIGCVVGALVAAPEFFGGLARRFTSDGSERRHDPDPLTQP